MLQNPIFVIGLTILVIAGTAVAQQSSQTQASTVELLSYGDLLREHHVDLTEPALIKALKNPDSDVRFLAAMKLSEDKVSDAIPEVKEALASEKVPRARVNLAIALGLLGDSGGRDELERLCGDRNFPPEFRLYAVRYMFDLHVEKDKHCLQATEEIVRVVDADFHTIGYRTTALNLLPQFRGLTTQESETILHLIVGRLDDPEPTVRMQASQSLVNLGNPTAALPYLEAAATREKEESVRNVFEKDLQKLRGHPKN